VPAAGLVRPTTVTVADVDAARTHVPLSVMVTTLEELAPVVVPEHVPVKPEAKVTLGDAGTVNADGKAIEMVSPDASWPFPEDLKPTVQVDVARAAIDEPENVTTVTELPAPVIWVVASTAAVSAEVDTLYAFV